MFRATISSLSHNLRKNGKTLENIKRYEKLEQLVLIVDLQYFPSATHDSLMIELNSIKKLYESLPQKS